MEARGRHRAATGTAPFAGPLGEVGERIVAARAAGRVAHGWIMDTYLVRRR